MRVLLECLPDETLARALGCARAECHHFSGRSRVLKYLERSKGLIGMVDEDPRSDVPPYFRHLQQVSEKHQIREMRDTTRGHRIIILRPQLEGWLLAAADDAGVPVTGFGVIGNRNDLHKVINSKLEAVQRLVEALERAGSARIGHLRTLLREEQ